MNNETAFLVTSGFRYEQQKGSKIRSPEIFNKRDTFTCFNEAILALNKIPDYYFSAALATQFQLDKSLDYAAVHDSDGVINVTKIYLGYASNREPGVYVTLHGISPEEYNKAAGDDLAKYPFLQVGTTIAYKVMSYEQMEKEILSFRQTQRNPRYVRSTNGQRRNMR
ncbi:hypothetical protein [Filimonas effusa]|uniref:Uncharacterized protein n=1 Tax=Filimonas effusa TaxID=2508721 RepID=A0A4Q1D258_9BACT|nr:hypothetical protein [Filimonas effusa]RXK81151.1 hypothetical protein ESB13_19615 [Filimonas effusa]